MASMTGGEKLMAELKKINSRLGNAGTSPNVSVGFMEDAKYPDGTSIAMVAAVQEFGATIDHPAGMNTIYRKRSKDNTHFLKKGRFVKRSQSNYMSEHAHDAYSITIPPRPFFRNMIKKNGPTWGVSIAKILKQTGFDTTKTLAQMGELIKRQLQLSINELVTPPNAPSTIAKKKASKPLIDTGEMWKSVDYKVST